MLGRLAKEKPKIDGDVDENNRGSKHKLKLAIQGCRINDAEQVVLDKAFRVTRLTGPDTKIVLENGERAGAAR